MVSDGEISTLETLVRKLRDLANIIACSTFALAFIWTLSGDEVEEEPHRPRCQEEITAKDPWSCHALAFVRVFNE